VSKTLNLFLQLQEYMILLTTLTTASGRLLRLISRNFAELVKDCTCKCAARAQTIEDCFLGQVVMHSFCMQHQAI
jgi:hypothetical protein